MPATVGRPRKAELEQALPVPRDREVDKAAEEIAKKRLIPRPPGKKIKWDEMQEWFRITTPEMWSHMAVYIYRDHPRIIRGLSNPTNPHYIDMLEKPFDMDYML